MDLSSEKMASELNRYAHIMGVACVAVASLDGSVIGLFGADRNLIMEASSLEDLACKIDIIALAAEHANGA